jgi:hypothetical protein
VEYAACMGKMTHAYKILVRKLEEKRPLGRSRHNWEDNITENFKKQDVRLWTEFISLRRRTKYRLLQLPIG